MVLYFSFQFVCENNYRNYIIIDRCMINYLKYFWKQWNITLYLELSIIKNKTQRYNWIAAERLVVLTTTTSSVAWGDQNSANVCPCACRKRRLFMGYELSYTTGLLYAWSSCMQWGVWVWTVAHWVVLVQVIILFQRRMSCFLKRTNSIPWEEIMSYSHSRKPDLPVTHHSPLSTWLSVLFFFSSPAKTTLTGRGYGFCWWRR